MQQPFEQLGLFYLGKRYDLQSRERLDDLVLYDSKDLVTHAVCVGMTGSGKTGLGITVIEEAALDGVPVIAIDPKGDLSNLLLTFPSLQAADFEPWVDPADAAAHGVTGQAFAEQQAARWKDGLAEWGEDGDRIARLRAAAEVTVFTPGSRAGTPLALLQSLAAPSGEEGEDAATRLMSTADSLLALVGVNDPAAHSRERTLITTILSRVSDGEHADLPWLVRQLQRPSFDRVGVLDLETFFPARERQDLALRFNSVLATPGFDVWLDGAPLDPGALFYTAAGKPRVAVISIAHLGDAERMLVVSLLLSAVVDWTRRQRGTTSLRALLYMDEVFGYLPPVANPPSKAPLLTLLKQARAYGVGVMLATQNPVDLDYKALSNTGTWFLGTLQTERDKARVLDGLEGVAAGLDRAALDRTLSALRSRVFLMHNVHEREPIVFETRWALSYLRGPLGRDELRRLCASAATGSRPGPSTDTAIAAARSSGDIAAGAGSKPIVPAGIEEVFVPAGGPAHHIPALYASAKVHYTDARRAIDRVEDVNVLAAFDSGAVPIQWDTASDAPVPPERLATAAPPDGTFDTPPAAALDPKRYAAWTRDFVDWVVRARPVQVFAARALKLTSTPGESEREFRMRAQLAAREARDAQVEKLRANYAARLQRATDKLRKAQELVGREEQQVTQQHLQTAVSVGATIFGALLGRKMVSTSTLGRATTAARGVSRSMKETEDVARAQERVAAAQQELVALQQEIEARVSAISTPTEPEIETVAVKPKRGSVDVRLVALAWVPQRR